MAPTAHHAHAHVTAILRRNGIPQCLCSWTAPSPYMIVAEEMSYYQCLRTEVPKLFHRNHLQCKSIRARCLLHVRGPVHHRRKYTSSHLRASVQRVRKTQPRCLKGPPPHVVHYLRKHALPPFCMYQLQGPPESRSEISGGPPRETHGIMIYERPFGSVRAQSRQFASELRHKGRPVRISSLRRGVHVGRASADKHRWEQLIFDGVFLNSSKKYC